MRKFSSKYLTIGVTVAGLLSATITAYAAPKLIEPLAVSDATATATATAELTTTPTDTPTSTATATNTAVPTDTPTATATNTAVPTDTPTATATPTATNTPAPTSTAVPTATASPTATATAVTSPSATPTATATAVGGEESALSEAIEKLQAEVRDLGAAGAIKNEGLMRSLLAKLDAAEDSAERGNDHSLSGQLGAFIHELEAQSGKGVTASAADQLIGDAQAIISGIGLAPVTTPTSTPTVGPSATSTAISTVSPLVGGEQESSGHGEGSEHGGGRGRR